MSDEKTCKICGKTFTRRNYMQKHMEHIHSKRFTCPTCFRQFSGPMDHACAVENGRYVCYVQSCSLRFASGMAMRLHIRDYHRKINEDSVDEVTKTKKGIRDMFQTLCKKINLLNNCFDELKYQVDFITDFLKTSNLGFESEFIDIPKEKMRNRSTQEQIIVKDEVFMSSKDDSDVSEDMSFDEEFITENYNNCSFKRGTVICKQTPQKESNQPAALLTIETVSLPAINPIKEVDKKKPNLIIPINSTKLKIPTKPVVLKQSISRTPTKLISGTKIIRLQNKPKIYKPVSQESSNLVKIFSKPIQNLSQPTCSTTNTVDVIKALETTTETELSKISSSTPPLFLNIKYDNQTTVCESDPKIIFHFDTKPPGEGRSTATD